MSTADGIEAIKSGRKKDKFYILKENMLAEGWRRMSVQLPGQCCWSCCQGAGQQEPTLCCARLLQPWALRLFPHTTREGLWFEMEEDSIMTSWF